MSQILPRLRTLVTASALLGIASTAQAAELAGPINKAEWGTDIPGHIEMFIAVPDNLPENAPILVNIHACGETNAGGQWSYAGFAPIREAMESVGFIMILPQQTQNCWDVGTTESLTRDGGGDTGAIIQMIQYVVDTYDADPDRVYAMGGSGGGMCVQALMAVYPDIFKGGHARAGVPAGCWAESYTAVDQWSTPCAGGQVDKTPQQWGDYVRAMNPNYTGPRPRLQINQGSADTVISFNNFQEGIDQWTNVLGLDEAPTSSENGVQGAEATYNTQFWDDSCGYTVLEMWEAVGMGHSMGYESVDILRFFGLDQVRQQDPWVEQCGDFMLPADDGAPADDGMATDDGMTTDDDGMAPIDDGATGASDDTATDDTAMVDDSAATADDMAAATDDMAAATDDMAAATDDMAAADDTAVVDDMAAADDSATPPTNTGMPGVGAGTGGTGTPPAGDMTGTGATGTPTTTPTTADTTTAAPGVGTTMPGATPTGTAGMMPPLNDGSSGSGDSGGCSVSTGSSRVAGFGALIVALGLLVTRRRRQASDL